MDDLEYEEEEELLVFADFGKDLESVNLGGENTLLKIIGLDSNEPLTEVNGNFFRGTYGLSMYTNVFLENDSSKQYRSKLFNTIPKQTYKPAVTTIKTITFKREYITKKQENADVPATPDIEDCQNVEELIINETMEELYNMFPKAGDDVNDKNKNNNKGNSN